MDNSGIKISGSGMQGLNTRLNQKNNDSEIENKKLTGQTIDSTSLEMDEKSNSSNEISHKIALNHDVDYKMYRFNGRLYRDESHLGQHIDITI